MKYSRSLIATVLMSGSLLNLVAPVLAQVVPLPAADSPISNTANATYEDPNVPNTPINTVSNTVVVKVAKVAGILVEAKGFTQLNATDAYKPGETIYSNFDVTNTGNDGVKFKVPKLADVSPDIATFQRVEYSPDGGTTWTTVTAASGSDSQAIAVGGKLKVRIVAIINAGAAAQSDIVTTLGNTSTPGLVNAERGVGNETIDGKDIYTVDITTAGTVDTVIVALGGTATNNVREASAQQKVKVNAVKQAFAVVDVTHGAPTPNVPTPGGTPSATQDDVKYGISVTVPTTDPTNTGKVATDLAPTKISLATNAGATTPKDVNRVIISDPLTTGTTLKELPKAPLGWTPVYVITSPVAGTPTVWSTVPPLDLTTVTQVGFIYEPVVGGVSTTTASGSVPVAPGTSLPKSITPYTGFEVTVITPQLGTQLPNVVSIDGTTPTAAGLPDLTKPVTSLDTDTVTTVRAATISSLYNGPESKPEATGPGNDNNKDFTNKSMQLLAADAKRDANGVLIKTVTSSVVTFNNTIENATNVAGDVYVLPTAPTNIGDLPNGTTVKVKNINGTDSRTYTYSGGVFTPITGEELLTPLKLAIGANGLVSYAVDVTLPAGQKQLTGFPVPITAFAGPTAPDTATTIPADAAKNITIDRVYTGYIDLIKEARLLDVITDRNDTTKAYVSGAAATALKAVPGKFIQYRITATNISANANGGSVDSKMLSATNIKMIEDGLATPNNWANTTSHAANSAETFIGTVLQPSATIKYDQGLKNNSQPDVSRYDVNLGTAEILPQTQGSFSFVRQVNKTP